MCYPRLQIPPYKSRISTKGGGVPNVIFFIGLSGGLGLPDKRPIRNVKPAKASFPVVFCICYIWLICMVAVWPLTNVLLGVCEICVFIMWLFFVFCVLFLLVWFHEFKLWWAIVLCGYIIVDNVHSEYMLAPILMLLFRVWFFSLTLERPVCIP